MGLFTDNGRETTHVVHSAIISQLHLVVSCSGCRWSSCLIRDGGLIRGDGLHAHGRGERRSGKFHGRRVAGLQHECRLLHTTLASCLIYARALPAHPYNM